MTRFELKEKTKALAATIRELKSARRKEGMGFEREIEKAKSDFRHHHLAACFLRGTGLDRAESNPDNLPDFWKIDEILATVSCTDVSSDLAAAASAKAKGGR